MNTFDAIVTAVTVCWLFCLVSLYIQSMRRVRTNVYYCTDELYYAARRMGQWIAEGKLKPHHHLQITSHLIKLAGRDVDIGFDRLRLIASPNGWTVYQALLAKRNLWKRLFIRTWAR